MYYSRSAQQLFDFDHSVGGIADSPLLCCNAYNLWEGGREGGREGGGIIKLTDFTFIQRNTLNTCGGRVGVVPALFPGTPPQRG